MKPKKTYQKPLKIEMDFEEALERFGTTDPAELPEDVRLRNKRPNPDHSALNQKSGLPRRKP